jgi:tRNA (guanine-N7-)-methyltransferase
LLLNLGLLKLNLWEVHVDNNSKNVSSNQLGIHDKLVTTVIKHRDSEYRKPIREHNIRAFEQITDAIQEHHCEVILDSGCGTGLSSLHLAKANPELLIIGVDQSEARLKKAIFAQSNLIFVRANCEDIWRLMVEQGIKVYQHYMLYPNPWPKSIHLKRRWHGHPVFKLLPHLSNHVELRSNWKTYLDEFAMAWQLVTGQSSKVEAFQPHRVNCELYGAEYLSLFERKYHQSGQRLFRLVCRN